ncbi:hypothetical protein, partial [Enterobacter kobei]|uniref:hypothetical protein n=1 Tax=Enterobacter kobei TaxID=208224 RepID=UPI0039C97A82
MSELKLNAIDFISFAVAGNTFKLKANLIGPNDQFHSVNLGRVRISTLRNENETFSQLNSITYIG